MPYEVAFDRAHASGRMLQIEKENESKAKRPRSRRQTNLKEEISKGVEGFSDSSECSNEIGNLRIGPFDLDVISGVARAVERVRSGESAANEIGNNDVPFQN